MADMKKVYDDLITINLYKHATRAAYYTFLPLQICKTEATPQHNVRFKKVSKDYLSLGSEKYYNLY